MNKITASPTENTSSDIFDLSLDSMDDDILEAWAVLLRRLSVYHIDLLHAEFVKKRQNGMTKEEFVNVIDFVLGNYRYSVQAISLFDQILHKKVDIGVGTINWTDYLHFVANNTQLPVAKPLKLSVKNVSNVPHIKRESVVKIVPIEMENYFCYAIVAKYGSVGLYDGNMNFLTSYQIIMTREDVGRSDRERRRRNRWITDAIFLGEAMMFVIANSTRSLTIYDASGLEHVPMWLITDFPNAIHSISFCTKPNDSRLIIGDESGQIIALTFVQPKIGFFRKKHNDRISIFYYLQLIKYEKDFVKVKAFPKTHSQSICQIEYYEDNHTLVSCSRDSNNSIIIRQLFANGNKYMFKMPKGASCFALSRRNHYLVTGGDDGSLRIWNPFVTAKPLTIFSAHCQGIVDVTIIDRVQHALSCSRIGEVKVWDLKEQKCVQTFKIKFPSFGVLGKCIEWGTSTFYSGPKRYSPSVNEKSSSPSSSLLEDNDSDEDDRKTDGDKKENINLGKESIDPWSRNEIYVTCCNYIASIRMEFIVAGNEETSVLPPPPLQNSVLIPKTWKIRNNDLDIKIEPQVYSEEIEKYVETLKFILEKDFLTENEMNNEINHRIAKLEAKKLEMRDKVKQCAPYLALDLYEMQEVKLPLNLPIPTRRKTQRLVERTQRMLSAASIRTALISESSSRSRSSRSSVIEFE